MDANHKKRLAELEGKGKLSKGEKTELAGIKKHQAETAKASAVPATPAKPEIPEGTEPAGAPKPGPEKPGK